MYDISFSTNMHYILPIFPTKYFTPTTSYICRESIYIMLINTDFHLLFISFSYHTMDRSYYTKIKGWKTDVTGKYRKWKFSHQTLMLLITFLCKQKWFVALLLFLQITFIYFTISSPFRKYLSVSFLSFTVMLYLY